MRKVDATALRISRAIHEVEDQLDRLIGTSGALLADVAAIRIDLDLNACDGQRPLQRLIEMQVKLAEARTKATGAHSDLKRLAETRADVPVGCPDPKTGFLREASAA